MTDLVKKLEQTEKALEEKQQIIDNMTARFHTGMPVNYTGDDESDDINCPVCGYTVALNDDYDDMRPKHCPECGTKLIY